MLVKLKFDKEKIDVYFMVERSFMLFYTHVFERCHVSTAKPMPGDAKFNISISYFASS